MSKPADGEPPLVRMMAAPTLPPDGPHAFAVPVVMESKVTKVARVVGIVRDVVVILVLAAAVALGVTVLTRAGSITGDVSGGTVPGCGSPSVDQWGTFCPETPGG